MKSFKTESKRILDLMINSIYTNKDIFLRELISNSSDALDKLYYKSLTENLSEVNKGDLEIRIDTDKEHKLLIIADNGIGMTSEELESNLGTIAKSGTMAFKNAIEKSEDVSMIGQFGVGFYSAFMVADNVKVYSKAYGAEQGYLWESNGNSGYEITPVELNEYGTKIILHIKDDTEENNYSGYLEEFKIRSLVKKYSDYIKYPIKLKTETTHGEGEEKHTHTEWETLNSMVPLWKKNKKDITEEEYNNFYSDMFYELKPLKTIHTSVEGAVDYKALMFIPEHAQYDYYTKEYEKGLRLYTNGVLIMEKCAELLPDYFNFVKGLVDCDLDLNISRETIQHSHKLHLIADNIKNKIKNELENMLSNSRAEYEKFFKEFGLQLKYGCYSDYGMNKDFLKDLLLFYSLKQEKYITLKEYVSSMAEGQDKIYYATGSNIEVIKNFPQTQNTLEKFDVLCATDGIDEFVFKMMQNYSNFEFTSVLTLATEENSEEEKELCNYIKQSLGNNVEEVKISHKLKTHPVCLSAKGDISFEMEKVLNAMPNNDGSVKAKQVLEINAEHKIFNKIKNLYDSDKEKLNTLMQVLYANAELMAGLTVENPLDITSKMCELLCE